MDMILLVITVVSLGVAFVMSVAAWRMTQDEKKRSAARVAALSLAAAEAPLAVEPERPITKAPWPRASFDSGNIARPQPASLRAAAPIVAPPELPLNQPRAEAAREIEPATSHASGFLGAVEPHRYNSNGQKTLAFAAIVLFLVLSGGLVWSMSGPRGTTAVAMGPNSPLELVSLTHERQNDKIAVSGLVRNPGEGKPIEHLSAVVFLFDRVGTFITSSRANVDFTKLGAGDESPFVVSLDAPDTVARYRVSFRTDQGIVPHIDKRNAGTAESTVNTQVVRQQ